MSILELFSGTKSIGKAFNEFEVISVDLDNKFNPTHNVNILEWDYKQYPRDKFFYIHASPPCILYANPQVSWYGRKKRHNVTGEMVLWNKQVHEECMPFSDALVLKTLEIIDYFKPKYWTMENPYHPNWNNIRFRPFLEHLTYEVAHYSEYNDYPIKKPTLFFNNFGLQLKRNNRDKINGKWSNFGKRSSYHRYVIPHDLCLHIKQQMDLTDIIQDPEE